MVFSSIVFIYLFLPFFFIAYFLSPKKLKNAVILAGSIAFYAWGAPKFIFVILGTTLIDFFVVRAMWAAEVLRKRKALLLLSVMVNLGLLVYFKYSNFFVENFNCHFTVEKPQAVRELSAEDHFSLIRTNVRF